MKLSQSSELELARLRGYEKAVKDMQPIINQKIVEALDRVKQSVDQHTVPEGRHLIARQYVENTIEFEKNRIKER